MYWLIEKKKIRSGSREEEMWAEDLEGGERGNVLEREKKEL